MRLFADTLYNNEMRQNFPSKLFLAPLAGYSDAAFRGICCEWGADLCFSEMVSSEALVRGHGGTAVLLKKASNEKHLAIQLFGGNPIIMAEATKLVTELQPILIDLNCGCPVPKITRSGSGAALMKEPSLLLSIASAMVAASGQIPITVKLRLGWDNNNINFLEIAKQLVDVGISAITLHARTKAQNYSGKAEWVHIANLVQAIPLPVFGSGDVWTCDDPQRMLEETGCAGVMVARGAIGNPFLFRAAKSALMGQVEPPVRKAEKVGTIKSHLLSCVELLGEKRACTEFRKHFCAYTKSTKALSHLRVEAMKATKVADYMQLLDRWQDSIDT